ncbi:Ctr copper transporter [Pseudovirgaria hyperparasitica]|uniref:Copper transport protein n=1 Tax=Pseudovirgaria hyperparasitica TaxID=470096 RepID=A0A6A6WA73_9PEZI|nr:Ctr copper transporter [Pseudovirgaria hyperparasitica]KAF2759069.1 Ctr copper transporter [Pseudovirgaria hyperparasitica]
MLWNWYTIDACFLSSSWHITSRGMFAGSMIGVILLVMALEFFRRLGKEYDRFLVRQYQRTYSSRPALEPESTTASSGPPKSPGVTVRASNPAQASFRPNLVQQMVRALLHMVQFAIAYIVMLLAMYYNGYLIICIFIGAFLGNFAFNWESIPLGGGEGRPAEDATVCCG